MLMKGWDWIRGRLRRWLQAAGERLGRLRRELLPTGGERLRRRHLRLGRLGERIAEDYLAGRGYELLCRNFRYRKSEIDLVMRTGTVLCFVEVKTRSWRPGVSPASAVDERKEEKLYQGGIGYLRQIGSPRLAFRFDIVEVLMAGSHPLEVRHWPGPVNRIRPG